MWNLVERGSCAGVLVTKMRSILLKRVAPIKINSHVVDGARLASCPDYMQEAAFYKEMCRRCLDDLHTEIRSWQALLARAEWFDIGCLHKIFSSV